MARLGCWGPARDATCPRPPTLAKNKKDVVIPGPLEGAPRRGATRGPKGSHGPPGELKTLRGRGARCTMLLAWCTWSLAPSGLGHAFKRPPLQVRQGEPGPASHPQWARYRPHPRIERPRVALRG